MLRSNPRSDPDALSQPAGPPPAQPEDEQPAAVWEVWRDARRRLRARPAGGAPVPGLAARNAAELRAQLREAALRALL